MLKETNTLRAGDRPTRPTWPACPTASIEAAAEAATKRGHEGKWVFTLHKPSLIPFLQYAENRDLREIMWRGYTMVGNNGDELDNKAILERMADLAPASGPICWAFPTHAHYVLDDNMAKDPGQRVRPSGPGVDARAWPGPRPRPPTCRPLIDAEGGGVRARGLGLVVLRREGEEGQVRPGRRDHAPLLRAGERARRGCSRSCNRLWGLKFVELTDVPVYQEDVKVYEVKDADGSTIADLVQRLLPAREQARRRLDELVPQAALRGRRAVIPIIYNVGNFTKPTADMPALLSADEVGTMFHEFGHALHGILSDCRYRNVERTRRSRGTSSRCPARSSRTGPSNARCSTCTRSTTRPVRRSPTNW